MLGNFVGDSEYGSDFCSKLVEHNCVSGCIDVIELHRDTGIEVFMTSFLYFSQNFIKNVPENHRCEVRRGGRRSLVGSVLDTLSVV